MANWASSVSTCMERNADKIHDLTSKMVAKLNWNGEKCNFYFANNLKWWEMQT